MWPASVGRASYFSCYVRFYFFSEGVDARFRLPGLLGGWPVSPNGIDPYTVPHQFSMPFLYPPNALPLFGLLAVPPFWLSFVAWSLFNSLISLALVPLAVRSLELGEGGGRIGLAPPDVALLCGLVALSLPVSLGLKVGEVSILVAGCLILSLIGGRTIVPTLLAYVWPSLRSSHPRPYHSSFYSWRGVSGELGSPWAW